MFYLCLYLCFCLILLFIYAAKGNSSYPICLTAMFSSTRRCGQSHAFGSYVTSVGQVYWVTRELNAVCWYCFARYVFMSRTTSKYDWWSAEISITATIFLLGERNSITGFNTTSFLSRSKASSVSANSFIFSIIYSEREARQSYLRRPLNTPAKVT